MAKPNPTLPNCVPQLTDETKICKKCGERKPLIKFPANKKYKGGRQHICAKCSRSPESVARRNEGHYERYKEQIKSRVKKWKESNRERYREAQRIYSNKRHAQKKAAGGSFTPQEWYALCASYSFHCLSCRKPHDFADLTIDHVVPLSKGGSNYLSNIQPLCLPCNQQKNAKTFDFRAAYG